MSKTLIEGRKEDHIRISAGEDVGASHNYWGDIVLLGHRALPELDSDEIDTGCVLFGRRLSAPIIVSAMTGGCSTARKINENLAVACSELGIGMGVGSQRAAIEESSLRDTYSVVADYDVPLRIANLGIPQFVPSGGYGPDEARAAMDMIEAHVLAVHLNYLQEVIQPEGDRDARGALAALGDLAGELPVVVKETGAGIDVATARQLLSLPVKGLDIEGVSGTTFSAVEVYRSEKGSVLNSIGRTFWDWGIPSPLALMDIWTLNPEVDIVASGGLTTGLDAVKALLLGADGAGYARALLKPAMESAEAAKKALETIVQELRTGMFLMGIRDLAHLKESRDAIISDGRMAITGRLYQLIVSRKILEGRS